MSTQLDGFFLTYHAPLDMYKHLNPMSKGTVHITGICTLSHVKIDHLNPYRPSHNPSFIPMHLPSPNPYIVLALAPSPSIIPIVVALALAVPTSPYSPSGTTTLNSLGSNIIFT